MTKMRQYKVRWQPIQYRKGNDICEINVMAMDKRDALRQIPERYSHWIVCEYDEDGDLIFAEE